MGVISADDIQAVLTGGCIGAEELDPDTSDLVVTLRSAWNGQLDLSSPYASHVHSATAENVSALLNAGIMVTAETASLEIANAVRFLLTTEDYADDWQGDLK